MTQTVNPVLRKIAAIASQGASKKDGKMQAVGKYNYHTIDGVLDYLRPLLADQGLVVTYDTSNVEHRFEGGYYICIKEIVVTITDIETGQYIRGMEVGYGIDKNDKGPGKATSYALKTYLVGTFALKGMPDENTQPVTPQSAPVDVSAAPGKAIAKSAADDLAARIKALGIDKDKVLAFAGVDSVYKLSPSKHAELSAIIDQREQAVKGAAG